MTDPGNSTAFGSTALGGAVAAGVSGDGTGNTVGVGALSPGQEVDDYRVVRLLGRGGMGEVYLARDTRLGRKVALKLIKGDGLGTPAALERFLLEARVTARFNHPHIVTVYGAGEVGGRPYVALEYLDGETLRDRYHGERPAPREAMRIGLAIADALREAHAHEVLHRDLKPENVVIPSDGRPRVLDFGLAKTFASPQPPSGEQITMTALSTGGADLLERLRSSGGRLAGTPAYMAPEQWQMAEVGAAVDLWALGLILYELLSGELPYREHLAKIMDLALRVASADPVPPLKQVGGCPAKLVELVGRCLAKDPAARPSAEEAYGTLSALLERQGSSADDKASPFRGLLPFTERQAALFFGRDAEIDALVEQLREVPVMTLVGPSGAGKSSLVRAGVLPRLGEIGSWRVIHMRPGAAPFETLASRLLGAAISTTSGDPLSQTSLPSGESHGPSHVEVEELADALRAAPGRLALRLERIASDQGGVVLFVDQLEELDTQLDDDATRAAFLRALGGGADDPAQPVRIVTTVRDDFLGRLADGQAGAEVLGRIVVLSPPSAEAMREALDKPLEAVGYRWEDDAIVDEMVAAVEQETAALPLLQFAADALWKRRDREGRLLTRAAYDAIGGVEGALASQAEQVLGGMTPEEVDSTRQLFLRLVSSQGTRRALERQAVLADLGEGADKVLDSWVAARLLTVRRGVGGKPSVELAHESLVSTWIQLRRWLDDSREERAFLEEVGQAAELWQRRGRPDEEVWVGEALWEAERKLAKAESSDATVAAFVAAGKRREGQQRRRRRRLLGAVVATLSLLLLGAMLVSLELFDKNKQIDARRAEAEAERKEADARRAESLVETAERALESGDVLGARARTRVALELGDDLGARGLWLRLRQEPLRWRRDVDCTQTGPRVIAFPSGSTLVHGCSGLDRWDRVASLQLQALSLNEGSFFTIGASSAVPRVATLDNDGVQLRLFDAVSGVKLIEAKLPARTPGFAIALGPNATLAALGHYDGLVRLVALAPPRAQVVAEDSVGTAVYSFSFSTDGRRLAAARGAGGLQVWDVSPFRGRDWREPCKGGAVDVAFARGEDVLYVACSSGDIAVVDATTGELTNTIAGVAPPGAYLIVRSLPNRMAITTTTYPSPTHGRVTRLDTTTGRGTTSARLTDLPITDLDVSPDGTWLAVANEDQLAVLRADFPQEDEAIASHDGMVSGALAIDPTGGLVASGDMKGTVVLWSAETGRALRRIEGGGPRIEALAFRAGGKELVGSIGGDTLRVWRVADGAVLHELAAPNVQDVLVLEDGTVVSASLGLVPDTTITTRSPTLAEEVDTKRIALASIAAVFAPDGSKVALLTHDQRMVMIEPRSGDKLWETTPDVRVLGGGSFAWWSTDGSLVAFYVSVGDEIDVVVHDSELGRELHRTRMHEQGPTAGAMVGRDEVLFGSSRWDLRSGRVVTRTPSQVYRWVYDARRQRMLGLDVRGWLVQLDSRGSQRMTTVRANASLALARGWWRLGKDGARELPAPPTGAWYQALAQRALDARIEPQDVGCLLTTDWHVEVWDLTRQLRLARAPATPGATFFAGSEATGCVYVEKASPDAVTGRLIRIDREGAAHPLADDVNDAVATSAHVVAAAGDHVRIFDSGDLLLHELELTGVGACADSSRGGVWLALADGRLQHVDEAGKLTTTSLVGLVHGSPSALHEGPPGTVAIGFHNGYVGLWSTETGRKLWATRRHGPVRDLWIADGTLYALTETGDTLVQSLSALTAPYCDLLAEVWDDTAVVWESGRTRAEPPDPSHPCRQTAPAN